MTPRQCNQISGLCSHIDALVCWRPIRVLPLTIKSYMCTNDAIDVIPEWSYSSIASGLRYHKTTDKASANTNKHSKQTNSHAPHARTSSDRKVKGEPLDISEVGAADRVSHDGDAAELFLGRALVTCPGRIIGHGRTAWLLAEGDKLGRLRPFGLLEEWAEADSGEGRDR